MANRAKKLKIKLDSNSVKLKAMFVAAALATIALVVVITNSADDSLSLGEDPQEVQPTDVTPNFFVDQAANPGAPTTLSASTVRDDQQEQQPASQLFDGVNIAANLTNQVNIDPDGGQDGSVRVVCHASHFSFDDPIVSPGEPGSTHLHMFLGNTLTDANSDFNSLANSGEGTCQGGNLNRTAYWIPTLHDTDGLVRVPQYSLIYYKSGPLHGQNIQEFPEGLRIIAGNARATSVSQNETRYNWYCGSPISGNTRSNNGKLIPDCAPGQFVSLQLDFPNCWDGTNLDSGNHNSHMAYSVNTTCPSSHPVPLPQITYNMFWNNADTNTGGWYLSSDEHNNTILPGGTTTCLLYTSPSPRDRQKSRMPSSA